MLPRIATRTTITLCFSCCFSAIHLRFNQLIHLSRCTGRIRQRYDLRSSSAGKTSTPAFPATGRPTRPNDRSREKALVVRDSDDVNDDDEESDVVAGGSMRRSRSVSVVARKPVDVA